ncbi:type II toxin-antitoxin system HipA family toxin [Lactococcus allomyrinae]|uniref:Type II toxin-antitoxin system HipA family toxin n=1 Tax=Lactococcus allomyrinae TaxID=2419773 RepID=A0A387B9J2_9LACT|nr:type II toxin-antitoxin system HipA family toxin [Lactococcus allomyrinae]AYG00393.1 type II toxin-antitoxin system HipA family toxin [Lactococcus allomyrinae]
MIEPKEIQVMLYGKVVGKLALTPQGLTAFQYDSDFQQSGYSISPLKLPLNSNVFVADSMPFQGNFGVFDDSLPDGWGRLLQDRELRKRGVDPLSITTLQRLAIIGGNGRGALEYRPVERGFSQETTSSFSLREIAEASEYILDDKEVPVEQWREIVKAGGSSGGARPKVFIESDGKEWLVKFPSQLDSPNVGEMEYRTADLARKCGIVMPETRLFDGKYFGTCRFDRFYENGKVVKKLHTVSSAGLLNANYRIPSLDYSDLLILTQILTRNMVQIEQMFRRMVFNIMIGNRDDHAKNFSFVMSEQGGWELSPAYDLLPSEGFNGFHTTTVNGNGRPTESDMINIGLKVGFSKGKIIQIIDEVQSVLEL